MQQFIHLQNLYHFVELLEVETDSVKREQLRALLLEEEDRFGKSRAQLDEADRLVDRGQIRIDHQTSLVCRLAEQGHDTKIAERVLGNMQEIQRLFVEHRSRLRGGQEAKPPGLTPL